MQSDDTRPLCRCGCGVPAHRDTGFPRGAYTCQGTETQRYWARVERSPGCWLWTGILKEAGSYGQYWNGDRLVRAHRVAWEMASGADIPDGFDVLHTCDVRHCVRNDDEGVYILNGIAHPRWGHLWLGTHTDNMADKRAKERGFYPGAGASQARGERQGSSKLTEDGVREVRRLLALGWTHRAIAAHMGVSKGPVTGISRGIIWKHVE